MSKHNPTIAQRADFFYHNGWLSYRPAIESAVVGHILGAYELARAEAWAESIEATYYWESDDIDSSDFSDERPPWALYVCVMQRRCDMGHVHTCGSLGGVDFGRGNRPNGPYKRIVEAQLALDAKWEQE